jgi:hypothetical protein
MAGKRWNRLTTRSRGAGAAWLGLLVLLLGLVGPLSAGPRGAAAGPAQAGAPFGQLWVQNLAPSGPPATVGARFRGAASVDWASIFLETAPFASELMALSPLGRPLTEGNYAAGLQAGGAFPSVGLAWTEWPGGAVTAYGAVLAATPLRVPYVVVDRGPRHETTRLLIQNPSATERVQVIGAYSTFDGEPQLLLQRDVEPLQTAIIDPSTDPSFESFAGTEGYVGLAGVVQPSGEPRPLAVLVEGRLGTGEAAAYADTARPLASTAATLTAPLVHAGWPAGPTARDSRIVVLNESGAVAEVRLTYRGLNIPFNSCAGQSILHGGQTWPLPLGGQVFELGPGGADRPTGPSGLPEGCAASALIEVLGGTALASVIELSRDGQQAGAYSALGPAEVAQEVFLPQFRHGDGQRMTTVYATNASATDSTVTATFTYKDAGGTLRNAPDSRPVAAGQTVAWSVADIAASLNGPVTVGLRAANAGVGLAVVAEDVHQGPGGDIALYTAQPKPAVVQGQVAPYFAPSVWKGPRPLPTPTLPGGGSHTPPTPVTPATDTPTPTGDTPTPTNTAPGDTPTPATTAPDSTPTATSTPFRDTTTPTPSATPTRPNGSPSATPSGCTPSDANLIVHAANDAERALLARALDEHARAYRQLACGGDLSFYIFTDGPGQTYRAWLQEQLDNDFAGTGFLVRGTVVELSYNDLAALRGSFRTLERLIGGAGGLDPAAFLPSAWAQGRMPSDVGPVQQGLPWRRAGCSEQYFQLAELRQGPLAGTIDALLTFLVQERQQRVNYDTLSPEGARLALPTLRQPYATGWTGGGGPVVCHTSPAPAPPDPSQVFDAVAAAREIARQLAPVRLKHRVADYSDGPAVNDAVYVTVPRGGSAIAQQTGPEPWLAFIGSPMTVRQPVNMAAMSGYLRRPEGVLVGELGVYAPAAPPPTPTLVPPLIRGPQRIFLPWTEVTGHPGPFRAFAVLWRDDGSGGGPRPWLVRPDGTVLDAAQVSAELGLAVEYEPVAEGEASVTTTVWAEQGSTKICWKFDGFSGCVKMR